MSARLEGKTNFLWTTGSFDIELHVATCNFFMFSKILPRIKPFRDKLRPPYLTT